MDGWRSFTWIYVGMGDLRPKKQKVVGDGRHISFIIQVIVVKAGASLQMLPSLLYLLLLFGLLLCFPRGVFLVPMVVPSRFGAVDKVVF